MRNRKEEMQKIADFAREHVKEGAADLLDWSHTGLLREGKVRELSRLCARTVGEHDALRLSERMFQVAALEAAAGRAPVKAEEEEDEAPAHMYHLDSDDDGPDRPGQDD